MKQINVGLIGLGTVGTGVVKILKKNAGLISERSGCKIKISKIADLDLKRGKSLRLAKGVLTKDAASIVNDPSIDNTLPTISTETG